MAAYARLAEQISEIAQSSLIVASAAQTKHERPAMELASWHKSKLYGFQFRSHAAGVLASMRIKAMRHGLVPLLTQA